MQEHQQESFLVDVHGCGHIMRILRGLNEKGKCIFYDHQMCIKNGRKGLEIGRKWYVWTKMSRRNEGWTGKKVYVWTKCPNKKWEEYGIKNY